MRDDGAVTYEFPASLDPDGSENLFVSIRYEQHDPDTLDVQVHLLGEQTDRQLNFSRLLHLEWNYVHLYGGEKAPQVAKIAGITGSGGTSNSNATESFIFDASEIQVELTENPAVFDRTFHVTGELLPSAILVQPKTIRINLSGEIKNRVLQDGEITVDTALAHEDIH